MCVCVCVCVRVCLQSLPGVYIAGELLDVFGRIGGFNFLWAWITGRLAGRGAAAPLAASQHTHSASHSSSTSDNTDADRQGLSVRGQETKVKSKRKRGPRQEPQLTP